MKKNNYTVYFIFLAMILVAAVMYKNRERIFSQTKEKKSSPSLIEKQKLSSTKLQVSIFPVEECFLGDMDMLLSDIPGESLTQDDLLLSVEPLVDMKNDFKTFGKRLNGSELTRGPQLNIDLKNFDSETVPFGVFLCLDRERTQRCSDKPSYEYEVLLEESNRKTPSSLRGRDKVYFFQYFYLSSRTLYFFGKDIKSEKQVENFIRTSLEQVNIPQSQKEAIWEKAMTYQKTLASYAVGSQFSSDESVFQLKGEMAVYAGAQCESESGMMNTRSRRLNKHEIPDVFKRVEPKKLRRD